MDIALVVSDVDGTLVTTDKRLTRATVEAVKRLDAVGIAFTLASSRPPVGLRSLVAALALRLPMGVYNGGGLVGPDLEPIAQATLSAQTAHAAFDRLEAAGIDVWVFSDGTWHLRDPQAAYTDLERRTLGIEPDVVSDLSPMLANAAKIVGVSKDFDQLAAMESELGRALGEGANVHRSQRYYLDITPPGSNKGSVIAEVARRLGLGRARIASLGDAGNDVPMFRASGLSIAMGNAAPEVQAAADETTASNDEDGFAKAIDRLLATP